MVNGNNIRRRLPTIAGIAAVAAVTIAVIYAVVQFIGQAPEKPKKMVQNITLIKPPPPPPPPKVDEPPPPPEMKEEVKLPEPEQAPPDVPDDAPGEDPPPGDLGLDAEGGAGGDGFGLLGRKGGRDLIGGGSGSALARYGMIVKNDMQSCLLEFDDIRKKSFNVKVKLRYDEEGTVKHFTLLGSTGNTELDKSIEKHIDECRRLTEPPPDKTGRDVTIALNMHF